MSRFLVKMHFTNASNFTWFRSVMRKVTRFISRTVMDKKVYSSFEEEVGITAFANSSSSFSGILKHRFSDFVVREVGLDGSIARLVDMTGSELENKWFGETSCNILSSDDKVDKAVKGVLSLSSEEAMLTEAQSTELRTFLSSCLGRSPDCPLDFTGIVGKDKASRTAIHGLFKGDFAKFVDSTTVQVGDKSMIRLIARHKTKENGVKLDKRNNQWPRGLGSYLQFTLLKENIDTLSAVSVLSKNLHLQPGSIQYNGTKDKRGVTAQVCTAFQKKPSDFVRTNAYEFPPLIRCGDFKYVENAAGLGGLAGNRFEIVLRAVDKPADVIRSSCEAMEQSGFINYFGLQRFGKGEFKSYQVGKAIMKSDFKACCDMMFTPSEHDRDLLVKAKEHYGRGEYGEALALLPNSYYAEKAVLQKLKYHPTDFEQAYNSIMKTTRLLCAHAYQSYIWNKAASRRVTEYGMKCVVGDLVPLDAAALAVDPEDAEEQEETEVALADVSEPSAASGNAFQKARSGANIHVVTEEDVASGKFSIRDVILPIPGYSVMLPANSIGDLYTDMLARDGLSLSSYSNTNCSPQYAMSGAYRRLIQMPKDFEWKVIEYKKFNQEITETELTVLRANSGKTAVDEESADASGGADTQEEEEKAFTALQLKFTLPPGTYATMMLRELTKESTESQFQAQLTVNSAKRSIGDTNAEEQSSSKVARTEN